MDNKQTLLQQIEEKRREMHILIDADDNYDDILKISRELDTLIALYYAEDVL